MPASTIDLQTPFDPTGYTTITAAQLEQLVAGSTPFTDKGLVVVTADDGSGNPDVPDAATTTKWVNYFWLRITATAAIPYVWNPNAASDVTYLQWQTIASASIGIGTIVNAMIADNTIQDVKIANLSYSKLTGAPSGLPPSGSAGGDLTGTYPNPSIGTAVVTTAKIATGGVQTANIADVNVTLGKLAAVSGSAKDMARVNGGATGMEAFTPPSMFTSALVVTTSNALKIPQVATAGAGDTGTWQMVAPTTLGRILQVVETTNNTVGSSSGALANNTSTPNYNATGCTAFFNTGAFTKIDTTGASKLFIEVELYLYDGTAATCFAGLYNATGATAPLAGCALAMSTVHGQFGKIRYTTAANPTNATYYVNIGSTSSGTCKTNTADGTNNNYGVMQSIIRITEYI